MTVATPAPAIKAIETEYAGCRFRSRLEARWAVFFDSLGVRWLYEPQGYDVGNAWYLPDFWLPDLAVWVEVKGRFGDGGWDLLCRAVWMLPAVPEDLPVGKLRPTTPSILVLGEIPTEADAGVATHPIIVWGINADRQPESAFQLAAFRTPNYLMPTSQMFIARSVVHPDALLASGGYHHGLRSIPDLVDASSKARRARFEHGETPAAPERELTTAERTQARIRRAAAKRKRP